MLVRKEFEARRRFMRGLLPSICGSGLPEADGRDDQTVIRTRYLRRLKMNMTSEMINVLDRLEIRFIAAHYDSISTVLRCGFYYETRHLDFIVVGPALQVADIR